MEQFQDPQPAVAPPSIQAEPILHQPLGGDDRTAFVNEPIDVAGLPPVVEETFEPLDPNYLKVRLIGDGIAAVVVAVASIGVAIAVSSWVPVLVGLGIVVLVGLLALLKRLEVHHLGYLVREKDFSYRRGVISRAVTTVPFARVQHVSIDRGPVERYFGLATLRMRTAGDGVTVAGVSEETATRLKALVVDRAGVAADEERADQS